jgi:hypothetical protein
MAAITTTTTAPAKGEHVAVPSWALAVVGLALFLAYLVLQENGLVTNNWVTGHELFHDARHALGFPCH